MMSCREIAHSLASDAWRDASLLRRLQIRMHLWMCEDCRRYGVQMAAMGRAARGLLSEFSEDQAAIDRLKDCLLNEDDGPRHRADRS